MTLLFRILYAAHASGTHHKLALDATRHFSGPDAESWQRLILKHHEPYLEGSKAPDKEFKDFKNHVLHVRDNMWGGAPQKARNWYAHLVTALKDRQWDVAAYAAGVLSHYYTDPIMPFHTAQSEAENTIHRAAEWSISKSYADLWQAALPACRALELSFDDGEDWLEQAVIAGAMKSNAYYEKLIAHYDFTRGVVDPPSGLDQVARRFLAELIAYATVGLAKILERAFEEAAVSPPDVHLTAQTVVASLKIPVRWVVRKMEDAEDRAVVQAMYDELQLTGTVEEALPEDDRTVRDLYTKEVIAKRADDVGGKDKGKPQARMPRQAKQDTPARRTQVTEDIAQASAPSVEVEAASADQSAPEADLADAFERRPPAPYLSHGDDVVDAPSIGPKTAERLAPIGIHTVADLLKADPKATADALAVRYITQQVVEDWQAQARLASSIPRLRGTAAQLLVAVGNRDIDDVATADVETVHALIVEFAATSAGERVLRSGPPPELSKVAEWIAHAKSARPALAA